MQQYVEYTLARGDTPASMFRHAVARIAVGKKSSRRVITDCGESIAYDDAYLFAMPDSEVNGRPAFERCHDCGKVHDESHIHQDAEDDPPSSPQPQPQPPSPQPVTVFASIEWLPPTDIAPSPHNHRKKFDALDELAASLIEKGMISPITVRPRPSSSKAKERNELVVGERRWRASLIAKLKLIPVIVRNLTDKEVIEIQLIENVQRVDVHPLEEADGYRALIDKHKYTIDQIAEKTGRSSSYVRARLKLTDLCKEARDTFLEGDLTPAVALMIARIPDLKLQKQATAEVLGLGNWNSYQASGVQPGHVKDDDGDREAVPLSQREAQVHLTRKYTLRLSLAQFATDDATLVPKAGACTTCVHRTGNQADLFADMKSADSCTKPECFEEKKAADWKRKSAAAAKEGVRVLSKKETEKVFEQYGPGTSIQYGSAYIDPKDKVPYDIDPSGKKTWNSLLGSIQVAKAVALDGAGTARTLIEKTSAMAALKKSGKLKEAKAEGLARNRATPNKYRDEQKKRELEAKRKKRAAELGGDRIVKAIADADGKLTLAQWRWFVECVLEHVDSEDLKRVARRHELELGTNHMRDGVRKVFEKWCRDPARTTVELIAMVAEAFSQHRAAGAWTSGYGSNIQGAAKVFGFDLKLLRNQVVAFEKATAKKPAKKGGKK